MSRTPGVREWKTMNSPRHETMNSPRHAYRPTVAPKNRRYSAFVYWRRRVIVALLVTTIVVVGYLGITLGFALVNPSYGVSMQARFAEWGRQHGLGPEVTWVETEYYKLNPAKKGGAPPLTAFGSGATAVKVAAGGHLAAPKTIQSPAAKALPGEGVWH